MKKIIKFYSQTCGPCKVMSKALKELEEEVTIENIDIADDVNQELLDKYKIRSVPTIIVCDTEKEEYSTFKGIVPIENIKDALQ